MKKERETDYTVVKDLLGTPKMSKGHWIGATWIFASLWVVTFAAAIHANRTHEVERATFKKPTYVYAYTSLPRQAGKLARLAGPDKCIDGIVQMCLKNYPCENVNGRGGTEFACALVAESEVAP